MRQIEYSIDCARYPVDHAVPRIFTDYYLIILVFDS